MSSNQPPFPHPVTISGRLYWRRRTVRCWLATVAGDGEPPPEPDDENLLNSTAVRAMCGGVSDMSLWRWRRRNVAAAGDTA